MCHLYLNYCFIFNILNLGICVICGITVLVIAVDQISITFSVLLKVIFRHLWLYSWKNYAVTNSCFFFLSFYYFPLVSSLHWVKRWKLPMISINFFTLQIKLPEDCSLKKEFIASATTMSLHPDNLPFTLSHKYLFSQDGSPLLCPTMTLGWPCRSGLVQNKTPFFFFFFFIWSLSQSRNVLFGRYCLAMWSFTSIREMLKVTVCLVLRQKRVSDIWPARSPTWTELLHCGYVTSVYYPKHKKMFCIFLQRTAKCLKHNNVFGKGPWWTCSITFTGIKVKLSGP